MEAGRDPLKKLESIAFARVPNGVDIDIDPDNGVAPALASIIAPYPHHSPHRALVARNELRRQAVASKMLCVHELFPLLVRNEALPGRLQSGPRGTRARVRGTRPESPRLGSAHGQRETNGDEKKETTEQPEGPRPKPSRVKQRGTPEDHRQQAEQSGLVLADKHQ